MSVSTIEDAHDLVSALLCKSANTLKVIDSTDWPKNSIVTVKARVRARLRPT